MRRQSWRLKSRDHRALLSLLYCLRPGIEEFRLPARAQGSGEPSRVGPLLAAGRREKVRLGPGSISDDLSTGSSTGTTKSLLKDAWLRLGKSVSCPGPQLVKDATGTLAASQRYFSVSCGGGYRCAPGGPGGLAENSVQGELAGDGDTGGGTADHTSDENLLAEFTGIPGVFSLCRCR